MKNEFPVRTLITMSSCLIVAVVTFDSVKAQPYSVTTQAQTFRNSQQLSQHFPSLPVFSLTEDRWNDIPWSTPAILRDAFTGEEELVVFDQNFQNVFVNNRISEIGILTVWKQDRILVREYAFVSGVPPKYASPDQFFVKVLNRVFQLQKDENDDFIISPDLRGALLSSNGENISSRIIYSTTQRRQDFEIGRRTILAWQEAGQLIRSNSAM
jgi:hypothetical protein